MDKLHFKKVRTERYGKPDDPESLATTVYVEIMLFIEKARLPLDVAQDALSMATDEVRDRITSDNPSWAERAEARKLTAN